MGIVPRATGARAAPRSSKSEPCSQKQKRTQTPDVHRTRKGKKKKANQQKDIGKPGAAAAGRETNHSSQMESVVTILGESVGSVSCGTRGSHGQKKPRGVWGELKLAALENRGLDGEPQPSTWDPAPSLRAPPCLRGERAPEVGMPHPGFCEAALPLWFLPVRPGIAL